MRKTQTFLEILGMGLINGVILVSKSRPSMVILVIMQVVIIFIGC